MTPDSASAAGVASRAAIAGEMRWLVAALMPSAALAPRSPRRDQNDSILSPSLSFRLTPARFRKTIALLLPGRRAIDRLQRHAQLVERGEHPVQRGLIDQPPRQLRNGVPAGADDDDAQPAQPLRPVRRQRTTH